MVDSLVTFQLWRATRDSQDGGLDFTVITTNFQLVGDLEAIKICAVLPVCLQQKLAEPCHCSHRVTKLISTSCQKSS